MPAKEFSTLWHTFGAAPHRSMFFGGALQSVAVMLWWLIELATRGSLAGHPLAWSITSSTAHGYLMIYGVSPFFIFGFLMTTFPRWMNGKEILMRHYMTASMLLMLGGVGFYAGLLIDKNIMTAALACTLAGWSFALYALLRVLLVTAPSDKRHATIILIALGMGWCGLAAFIIWLLTDNPSWLQFSMQGGLWLFLLPVFASVAHRMVPFFTSSALPHLRITRPYWPWRVILISSLTHGLLELADQPGWLWTCDAPLAIAAFFLASAWGSRHTLHIPLLGILHIGLAWLGFSMLLFGVQSFASLLDPASVIWGLAPLHALTIGCFATLMIGMATRVTLGHSGLPMKVDNSIKLMFIGVQLAAVLRVLADMAAMPAMYWLYISAAAIWLASFTPWILRFLPVYWQKRADDRPG